MTDKSTKKTPSHQSEASTKPSGHSSEHRQHESASDTDRKQVRQQLSDIGRRNRLLALLIVVIAFIIVAVAWYDSQQPAYDMDTFEGQYQATLDGHQTDTNYLYNGFVFIYDDPVWKTRLAKDDGTQFQMSNNYGPREVESIPSAAGVENIILTKDIVGLTVDTNLTSRTVTALYEVGKVIGDRFDLLNKPTQVGTTTPTPDVPTITCANATESYGVIIFHKAQFTQITRDQDNCIHVTGPTEDDIVKAANRLVYQLLNVMPDEPVTPDQIGVGAKLGSWDNDTRADGVALRLQILDEQGRAISPQGRLEAVVSGSNGTALYQWQTDIIPPTYAQTGTVDLQLAVDDFSGWPQARPWQMHVRFVMGPNRTISGSAPITVQQAPLPQQ